MAFDLVSRATRAKTENNPPRRVLSLQRATVLAILTVVSSPLLVALAGGPTALLTSRQAVSDATGFTTDSADKSLSAPSEYISTVLPFLALYCLVQLRRANVFTYKARPGLGLLTAALVTLNLLVNNPISQPRFWIATIVLSLVFTSNVINNRQGIFLIVFGLAIGATVIFPYLDAFRYTDDPGLRSKQVTSPSNLYMNTTDYGSNVDVWNSINFAERYGYTDGQQMAAAVFFFVPRRVWPGKAHDTATVLAESIGFPNRNLDCPLWCEGYIDFGPAGAIGVLGVYGAIAGRLESTNWRIKAGTIPSWGAIALPVLAGYQFIVVRGSLLQAMGRLSLLLIVFILVTRPAPYHKSSAARPPRGRFGLGHGWSKRTLGIESVSSLGPRAH